MDLELRVTQINKFKLLFFVWCGEVFSNMHRMTVKLGALISLESIAIDFLF